MKQHRSCTLLEDLNRYNSSERFIVNVPILRFGAETREIQSVERLHPSEIPWQVRILTECWHERLFSLCAWMSNYSTLTNQIMTDVPVDTPALGFLLLCFFTFHINHVHVYCSSWTFSNWNHHCYHGITTANHTHQWCYLSLGRFCSRSPSTGWYSCYPCRWPEQDQQPEPRLLTRCSYPPRPETANRKSERNRARPPKR